MLMIRMQRFGRKNDPTYRITVSEKTAGPKSGKYVERVGFYDPIRKQKKINKERVEYWMSKGAKVSDTLHNLLVAEGIVEGKKVNALPKKSPVAKEEVKEEKKVDSSSEESPVEEKAEASTEEKDETPSEDKTETTPEEKTPEDGG